LKIKNKNEVTIYFDFVRLSGREEESQKGGGGSGRTGQVESQHLTRGETMWTSQKGDHKRMWRPSLLSS
jgi:hypothetical protein